MTEITCEAGQFKKFIELVKVLNSECRLHIGPKGISTRLVDTANIAMGNIEIPSKEFKNYKFNKKCPTVIGLDLNRIARVLKSAKPATPLKIKFVEGHLTLQYDEITASIEYMDVNAIRKDPNPPTIELGTTFSFEGSLISKLDPIFALNNEVTIIVKDGMAKLLGEQDNDKTTALLSLSAKGEAEANYDWSYLFHDSRNVFRNVFVSAEFKQAHPMKITAEIQGIKVEYLYAPRIHNA